MDGAAEVTGNDYVSIPFAYAGGGVDAVNVLHGGMAGLVEWAGDGPAAPLFALDVRLDGQPVPTAGVQWRRLDRWIPTFTVALPDSSVLTVTVCAPGGYPAARGFLFRVELESKARTKVTADVVLAVAWRWTRHRIATARPLGAVNRLAVGPDGVLLLESDSGVPALAVAGSQAVAVSFDGRVAGAGDTAESVNGDMLRALIRQSLELTPQRRASVSFYVGAGRERDGAVSAARALRRTGADAWIRQARMDLSLTLRAGHDHRWGDTLNRNLLFCRYFALGRGIDDDRIHLLRSRSPLCPSPALANEREALLWTLPALILADPGLAREALMRVLETFSERAGEFLRYVDGGAFDPGFALDQVLLYPWAIDHYVRATEDASLLDEPLVRQVLLEIDSALFMRLHPQHMLCATELLPSGDAADHPYTTFGNALLWVYCNALPRLAPANGNGEESPPQFEGAASEVAAAVWQHLVTEIDGLPVLASSASLDGEAAVYDDPAGSLSLLPWLGFCPPDDPLWTATMEFLRSGRYPLWRDGAVPGLAARGEAAHARLASLCADLLGPAAEDALERLLRIDLPRGIAAAAWDPTTGAAAEPDHAALAGFLAWSLIRAAEARGSARPARSRPRR